MSHVDAGPLANYSSLLDPNLAGYFSNTRIKKHLRRAGLVTRDGAVVTENEFRLKMARKEHRRQVREMLASAIVNKTLDMERRRQALIRQKLEEIASIELVKRVKAHRKFGYEAAIEDMVKLNLTSSDSKPTTAIAGEEDGSITDQRLPSVHPPSLESVNWSQSRPSSGPPQASRARNGPAESKAIRMPRAQSGPTARNHRRFDRDSNSDMTDHDDDDDGADTEQLWITKAWAAAATANKVRSADNLNTTWQSGSSLGPQSPQSERRTTGRPRSSYSADRQRGAQRAVRAQDLDYRHLSKLDRYATEKYGLLMDREETGRHESPYIENSDLLVPHPPETRRRDSAASSRPRRRPSSGSVAARLPTANIPRDEHGHPIVCPKDYEGKLMLHRTEPAFKAQEQMQTFCEVVMRFFGSHINLERDGVDPRHEIVVEQQHCGGSTLTVFRAALLPRSNFTFISRRHSGYPFGLTFYVDGVQDIRLSACCEYKHRRGYRLGGKTGHFGFIRINGSVPCYRCKAEREARAKSKKPKNKERKHRTSIIVDEVPPPPVPELPSDPTVETAVGSESTEPTDRDGSGQAPENDYEEDFDHDDGDKRAVSSDSDSEHGMENYEDNFEADDDVGKSSGEIMRSEPLEIAVADDSDEEEPRHSKEKYHLMKVVKALPIPIPDNVDTQQDSSIAGATSSDWQLVVNMSKPHSNISAADAAKPPPAPSRSTPSIVGGRQARRGSSSSISGGLERRDDREAAGEGSIPSPRSIASDEDADLFGTTHSSSSSSSSSTSSPPQSGRQSPLPRGEKVGDEASVDQDAANKSVSGASRQLTPADTPSKLRRVTPSTSPTSVVGDQEITEERAITTFHEVHSAAPVGGDNLLPSNTAREGTAATTPPAAEESESSAESIDSDIEDGYEKPVSTITLQLAPNGILARNEMQSGSSSRSTASSKASSVAATKSEYKPVAAQETPTIVVGDVTSEVPPVDSARTVTVAGSLKPSASLAPSDATAHASREGDENHGSSGGEDGNGGNSDGSSGSLTSSFSSTASLPDSEPDGLADDDASTQQPEKRT